MADEKDSKNNLLQLFQPSLIMGVPDYYGEQADFAKQQADYRTYIAKLFTLTGTDEAEATALAEEVYNTEKSLSKIVYTMLERRDSQRNYNKMSMEEFYKSFKFPYQRYFEGRTVWQRPRSSMWPRRITSTALISGLRPLRSTL